MIVILFAKTNKIFKLGSKMVFVNLFANKSGYGCKLFTSVFSCFVFMIMNSDCDFIRKY